MRRIVLTAALTALLSTLASAQATAAEPRDPAAAKAKHNQTLAMVVEFTVRDYAAWRPVFDAADPQRVRAGVTAPQVFRDADSPNRMLVLFKVANRTKGDTWMKSETVREAMRKGGVIGEATHRFAR